MKTPNGLRILPLGGLGEIGMNCMVFEFDDEIIVVDCGIMFSDLDDFGVQFVIPDFKYLVERKEKIKAIVLTHGHEDHIGAVPFLVKAGIHAPVYGTPFTMRLLTEKLKEYMVTPDLRVFKMGDRLDLGKFKVRAVSVNHSIVDACALFIDTPVGRIIHTGDFKIDPTPFFGRTLDEREFAQAGDEGVLLLMSDSTNVERHTHTLSESVIYTKFEQLFAAAKGLTVVAMFASNISRMGQVFDIAKRMRKRVALSGRGMEQNVRLALEAGYFPEAQSVLIGLGDLDHHSRSDVVVMSTGSQAEQGSALSRVALGEHKQLQLTPDDLVVLSSRYIPGNEKAIGKMINQLFKQGANVLYEAVHDIHVSGHASRPELKKMLELTRPKYFIPVHGEYRHLFHHAALARETGVPDENVLVITNGAVVELGKDHCTLVEQMDEPRVLLDGRQGHDVSRQILKERRQIGETGAAFVLMVRNKEDRRIIAGPEVISKGLVSESMEGWLVEEAKEVAKKVIADYDHQLGTNQPPLDLAETVRIEMRRFFNQNLGKKPVVIPLILEM